MKLVLPAPGEAIKFKTNRLAASKVDRTSSATWSLALKISLTTGILVIYLNTFYKKFSTTAHLQFSTATSGAQRCQRRAHFKVAPAIPTASRGWLAPKTQGCSLGQRIPAQNVKVKLNRVIHNTAQAADDQVNSRNASGAVLLGGLQGQAQYTLRHRKFVHPKPTMVKVKLRPYYSIFCKRHKKPQPVRGTSSALTG
jgi:hypothetical protein